MTEYRYKGFRITVLVLTLAGTLAVAAALYFIFW
jgi:hypothetical protein